MTTDAREEPDVTDATEVNDDVDDSAMTAATPLDADVPPPIELTEAALEALLFVAEKPLTRREIAALAGTDRATVDAFHAAALAAGGKDNGQPGLRPHYHQHHYGAFVHDPDGNNVEAVCHAPE